MQYFVIGEREIVLAFGLVGVEGAVAMNRDEALNAFNKVTGRGRFTAGETTAVLPVDQRPKVLILTEEVSSMLEEEVTEWQMEGQYPLVVEVPGLGGHLSGRKTLTDSIREAVGISV